MSIFKKNTKYSENKKRVIGAYAPIHVTEYMHLFSIVNGKGIGDVYVQALEHFIAKQIEKGLLKEVLIADAVQVAYGEYLKVCKKKTMDVFLKELKIELSKKPITEQTVKTIIDFVKDAKENTNTEEEN